MTGANPVRASSVVQRGVRAVVPSVFLPLCLLAGVIAAAPWLRSFPASLAAVPLYGAALLSVLVPLVVGWLRPRWLWRSVVVDVAAFVGYALVVVLESPVGFSDLWQGLIHGPSEILTFALPLVSPRNLMVAPTALTWAAGAVAGHCIARRWYTLLPYTAILVAFGLAYAGTQRAADASSSTSYEPLLAGALLVTLLLMRAAQAWVRQDETAESTQPEGVLPLRGLLVGVITAVVIALIATLAVRTSAFPKRADTPQRIPNIDQSRPLTPLAFVAGLRPRDPKAPGKPVFTVTTDSTLPGYFPIANTDFYDGSGWSFDRTFRPSGGVLPDDTDPALQAHEEVTQQYQIGTGPLAGAPWMPSAYRAQRVTGVAVTIDPGSGMIVPANNLVANTTYTVRSGITPTTFDRVKTRTATPDTATSTIDTQLPGSVRSALDQVVHVLSQETHTPTSPPLTFLQALALDLRTKYTLSTDAHTSGGSTASTPAPATSTHPTPSTHRTTTPARGRSSHHSSHHPRDYALKPLHKHASGSRSPSGAPSHPSPTPTPTSSPAGPAGDLAGGTGFADVLASILGQNHSGTPEQFATLLALAARDLGVPARVVTGFRVQPTAGAGVLPAGRYDVTTADAWTWTEVPINGIGWVVLDGSPARFSTDKKPTQSGAPPPTSSSAPPSQNPLITQGDHGGNAVAPKSSVPHSLSAPAHAVLIAVLVAIALLVIVIIVVLLTRKRVRAARRRRSPDPRERVVGAWRENLDVLAEAGLPDLSALTTSEIAVLAGRQFGDGAATDSAALGAAADTVTYSTTMVADHDAEQAWARQRSVRKEVMRRLGVRGRLAAGLRYHRHDTLRVPTSPASWAGAAAESAERDRRRSRGRRARAH